MIEEFNLDRCRESAVIYQTMYKLVSRKYKKGSYEEAAELALAFMQVSLLGETTSDDEDIQDLCEPYLPTARKNVERYESRLENDRVRKIEDMRLEEIAAYANKGFSARDIEDSTGIPKSTVSYRLGIIRREFPELLEQGVQLSKVSKLSKTDTDTDTDTVTVTETDSDTALGFGQAERQAINDIPEEIKRIIDTYNPKRNDMGLVMFETVPSYGEALAFNEYLSNHPTIIA